MMITKFNKFNESIENEMTVNIVIDTNYGSGGISSWTKDNKNHLKHIHGSYMGGQLEANIDRSDYDAVAKLPGVVDMWEIDWIEPKVKVQEPTPAPAPKSKSVLVSVDNDGNIKDMNTGKIIGKLPPNDPLWDDIEYQKKLEKEQEEKKQDPRYILMDELTFDVNTKDEVNFEMNFDLLITFWTEDGMFDDDFPMDLFPEFEELGIHELSKGQFEYTGKMSKVNMIRELKNMGFEYESRDSKDLPWSWEEEGEDTTMNEESELVSITCESCGGTDCEFMVSGEDWGTVLCGPEHSVTFSYDNNINNFKKLAKAIKNTKEDDLTILASCNDCADEASVVYKFKNGYKTRDDEKAFKLAYPELFKNK